MASPTRPTLNTAKLTATKGVSRLLGTSLLLASLSLSPLALAGQSDLDKETSRYVRVLSGDDFIAQKEFLKRLSWAGVSSPEVYDLIADKLVSLKNVEDKAGKDQAAWFAKALGYSGNEKYRAVLQDMADNASAKKLRKYGAEGLANLDKYRSLNPIISANEKIAPEGRLMQHRITNMMNSNDYWLVKLGAKRAHKAFLGDKKLTAVAAKRLKAEYKNASKDNGEQIDSIAWMIKVVGDSGDTSYRPLLNAITSGASNKKVKKYAKKYAANLQ